MHAPLPLAGSSLSKDCEHLSFLLTNILEGTAKTVPFRNSFLFNSVFVLSNYSIDIWVFIVGSCFEIALNNIL